MKSRHVALAILLVGLGSRSPIGADDAPGPTPPPPTRPVGPVSPTSDSGISIPDPSPYLEAAGAAVVGVSRDGAKVFFTRRVAGIVQLFVTDADGKAPRQLTTRAQSLSFAVPSPDGTKVVLGYDKDGDENTGLFIVETGAQRPATTPITSERDFQRGGVVWAPEGDAILYRANDGDRASFHIKRKDLTSRLPDQTVFDAEGSWRVEDVAKGGEQLLLVRERSNRDASLFLFHVKSRSLTEIHPCVTGATSAVGEARFVGDGSKIVFSQEYPSKNEDARVQAWLYDTSTGEAQPTPSQGFGSRHGCIGFGGDAHDVAASLDGSRAYVRWSALGSQFTVVDVATNEEIGMLRSGSGEYSGLFVDGLGRVYSSKSSPSDPGSIVRWDAANVAATSIVAADLGTLGEGALPDDPTLISFSAADKLSISAWLWLPKGRESKNLPFVVSIHGGPEGEDRPGWHADRAYLLSLGFGVLAPNVRGSTGRGRLFRDADDGAKRMDSVRDAKAAADWLVEKGYADPKRLGVMGGSYGGFMVMALLTEYPDRFVAGAEAVGIVNFETFLENTSSYRRALREAEYGSLSDRALLRSISPIHKLDRITAALLVAHGENDPRVPVGEARQIEAELKRLGRPVETLIFADEGHGFRKPANRKKYIETVARFFLRHLAPR